MTRHRIAVGPVVEPRPSQTGQAPRTVLRVAVLSLLVSVSATLGSPKPNSAASLLIAGAPEADGRVEPRKPAGGEPTAHGQRVRADQPTGAVEGIGQRPGGRPGGRVLARRSVSGWPATVAVPAPGYGRGLGALAGVLLLIGGTAWVVKRWVPAARRRDSRVLRIVARTSLSPKQSVVLLHVGRRFLVVGLGGGRPTSLCEIEDPEEVAELALRVGLSPERNRNSFDELLRHEQADYGAGPENENHGDNLTSRSFLDRSETRRYREPVSRLLSRLRSLQAGARPARSTTGSASPPLALRG